MNSATSTIHAYYNSLESRIGYRLFLGGTRHFGYYPSSTSSPFPITSALRQMEAKLLSALNLPPGSRVLDAGCGVGHVALYMAQNGNYHVSAIDLTPHHVEKATANISRKRAQGQVSASVGDYYDLRTFKDNSFDGVYTMETVVHSTNAEKVLEEFRRVLKPGGILVMHEYEHMPTEQVPKHVAREGTLLNAMVGMQGFQSFANGDLERLAQRSGFEDVELVDMSKHVVPMLWLFYVFAFAPFHLLKLVGLQYLFLNIASGVWFYKGRDYWRYVQIRGKKPA